MVMPTNPLSRRAGLRRVLVLCILVCSAGGAASATTPSVDWVVRYNGLGNGNCQTTDMAVDAGGCAYVTGYSSGRGWDFATVKYSPGGRQLHAARYNGAPGGDDVPSGIVLDRRGDVYVVGYSAVSTQFNYDFVTIKYDSTLTQQWIRVYTGQGNFGLDAAYAVAADSLGNVYATGESFEPATDSDIVTVKYNSAGVFQWAERYNGIGNAGDAGNAITIDRSGFVYITGITQRSPSGGDMDLTTIKYDSNGVAQWAQIYDGPAGGNDGGIAVGLDSAGNVYVAGFSTGIGSAFDFTTVKYAGSDGHQLWLRTYDPERANDAAKALVVDGSDNVIVTGFATITGTESDYATIKYDSAGNQLWLRTYDGPVGGFDEAQSAVLDRDGNVYITGYSDGGTGLVNYDYATIRYDAAGNQQWLVRYNGTGNNIDIGVRVALDPQNNVIVGGWSTGTHLTDVDFTTIKYDQHEGAGVPPAVSASRALRIASEPNPFDDQTRFRYSLASAGPVELTLWNVSGRCVRTLFREWRNQGEHEVVFKGDGLPAGVYVFRLKEGDEAVSGKIVRR